MPDIVSIPAPRYKDTIEKDEAVRSVIIRASRMWAALLIVALAVFVAGLLLVFRYHVPATSAVTVCWMGSVAVLLLVTYGARVIIERKQLPVALAAAIEHYKRHPNEIYPGTLELWHKLLIEAGVNEFPEGLEAWLDGPHAKWLIVVSSTLDAHDRWGSWNHDRAVGMLSDAAKSFAVDSRRVARRKKSLAAAQERLDFHFNGS
jgi:hypothetical protein